MSRGSAAVAAGFAAAVLGLAAPAQAATEPSARTVVASPIDIPTDVGHHGWVLDISPHVNVPHR